MRPLLLLTLACMCMCLTASAADSNTILLARGDSLSHAIGNMPVDLWLFSNPGLSHLYDISAMPDEDGIYQFNLTPDQSASLSPGKYSIIAQYPGEDTYNIVHYEEKVNVSGASLSYLVSPFRNVKDVSLDGLQPHQVKEKLMQMINASDDGYTELSLEVQEPHTYINAIEQWNESAVRVTGYTNLQDGTKIKILWDEDKLVSAQDYRLNTFYTYASAASDSDIRTFGTNISVNMDELSDGKHWVAVEAGGLVTRVAINVGISFNQSEIRMEPIKYLWNGVVVTPTPIIIEKPVYIDRTVIQTVITIITTQPFPKNALGEEYDPTKVPDVSAAIIPIGAGLLAIVVLKKGQGNWKVEPKRPTIKVPDINNPHRTLLVDVVRKEELDKPVVKKMPVKERLKSWIDRTFWVTVPQKEPSVSVPERELKLEDLYEETQGDEYFGQL